MPPARARCDLKRDRGLGRGHCHFAPAAAHACHEAGEKDPAKIVKKAMGITANLCIYTNDNITILKA